MSVADLIRSAEGHGVSLRLAGDNIKVCPASKLPPKLIEELRRHKPDVVYVLSERPIRSTTEVLEMARARFDTKPFNPDEHPPPPGMLAYRDTDKAKFFAKGDGWREARPKD